MKIFVIGSYFEDSKEGIERNVEKARRVGIAIAQKGHLPFVPQQHFAFWETQLDKKQVMELCFDWIRECDAVLVINEAKKGSGTERAVQIAKQGRKPVFYSLDEVPLHATQKTHKSLVESWGWYGAVALLGGFALVSFGILDAQNVWYQLLNLTGAAGIVAVSVFNRAYPQAVLNIVWTIIAIVALVGILF